MYRKNSRKFNKHINFKKSICNYKLEFIIHAEKYQIHHRKQEKKIKAVSEL